MTKKNDCWLANNQNFLQYVWENFSSYIKENYHHIFAIRMAGSRGLEMIDDRSDYDIEVYLWDENYREQPKFNLFYRNKRVHWYYHNPKKWLFPRALDSFLFYSGLVDIIFLNRNNWLSCTKEGDKFFDFFHKNKNFLSSIGCKKVLEYNYDYFERFKTTQDLLQNPTKMFYHKIKAWQILHHQSLDKDFLLKIKRIRWQNLPEDVVKKASNILNQITLNKEEYELSNEDINKFNSLWRSYGVNICE